MTDTTQTLQRLADKDAIWECSLRYTRGLDRLDVDLFRAAYWPDAHTCHGRVNGSVDDFLDWWLPMQDRREYGSHCMMNQRLEFDGDDAADGETYFLASIKNKGEAHAELLSGRYVDRFEKRDGEWKIKTRILIFEWQGLVDASHTAERYAGMHRGTRDRTDPSFEHPLQPRLYPPTADRP